MNADQAKALLERFAPLQSEAPSKWSYRCPRCGNDTMTEHPALSRRATISVCDRCGIAEAVEDMMGGDKLPLEEWAISQHPELFGLVTPSEGECHTGQ